MLKQGSIFDNRYQLVRLLGRGGFSEVWLAKDAYTHLDIAIKVYAPGQGMDTDGLVEFSQELVGVFNLNHTNLLKPTHVDAWEGMPYLILPFCSQGSIVKRVGKMSEEDIWKMMHDVASGLAYLHQHDIVHQDIKPDNILVDDNGNYLITDFGISTKARSTLRKSVAAGAVNAGTMAYMGPERFSKQPTPTRASDIWSFGAMVYELITGNVPFGDMGGGMQKNNAEIPDINELVSDDLKQVVEQMMALDKDARPTANQLVEIANTHLNAPIPTEGRKTQRIKERKTQRIEPIVATPEKKEAPKEETLTEANNPNRKKRIIGWSIAAAVLVAVGLIVGLGVLKSAPVAVEEHVLIDGVYYNLRADKTAEVVYEVWDNANNYKDLKGKLNIPSSVHYKSTTYTVASIGEGAFLKCKGVTSVIIPNSVTSIGVGSFAGCTNLTSVTIPNSVTNIGSQAFADCSSMKTVVLPNSVTSIGYGVFWETGIKHPVNNHHVFAYLPKRFSGAYTIPDGIEHIAGGAFAECDNLSSITIPNSVTSIGEDAFVECTSLTSVDIPDGVTSIGNYAFADCIGLISVSIPNSVTSIGEYAFSDCTNLTSVTLPKHINVADNTFMGSDQVEITRY